MADLPVFAFSNRDNEDIDVAWQMTYAGDVAEFALAYFRCTLTDLADPNDLIDFSSDPSAVNRIFVDAAIDGSGVVTFSFKAPRQSVFGRAGAFGGELLRQATPHAADIAYVSATIIKASTSPKDGL